MLLLLLHLVYITHIILIEAAKSLHFQAGLSCEMKWKLLELIDN